MSGLTEKEIKKLRRQGVKITSKDTGKNVGTFARKPKTEVATETDKQLDALRLIADTIAKSNTAMSETNQKALLAVAESLAGVARSLKVEPKPVAKEPEKVDAWTFEIERDYTGLIKTIEAKAK